jgi:hypothetical protein
MEMLNYGIILRPILLRKIRASLGLGNIFKEIVYMVEIQKPPQ